MYSSILNHICMNIIILPNKIISYFKLAVNKNTFLITMYKIQKSYLFENI